MTAPDKLSIAMQDKAIQIAEERMRRKLTPGLEQKIRSGPWSYSGLEMIIDTIRTINVDELEGYLHELR